MSQKNIGTQKNVSVDSPSAFTAVGTSPSVDSPSSANSSDEQSRQIVLDRYDIGKSYMEAAHTRFDTIYKIYMGYTEPKDKIWVSNIFVPTGFTVIETLLPKVIAALFGKKFFLRIAPRETGDIGWVKILTELLRYQMSRMQAFRKYCDWIKTTLMYGVGVIKTYWRYEEKVQTVYEPFLVPIPFIGNVKVGRRKVRKTIIKYDDPDFEVVDIYDFFYDPRATCIKNSKWVIHRVWVDIEDIISNPNYNDNKHKLIKGSGGYSQDMNKDVRNTVRESNSQSNDEDNNKIMLLEMWEADRCIVLADELFVIRDEKENPNFHTQIPFQDLRDVAMPHEFIGRGEIEPIKDLIYERNAMRSQRLDNVKNIVNRKLVVDRNADIDLETLDENNKPGGIILTDNVDAIKYLQEIDIVASSYQEDAIISRDIQEASAISETTMGMSPRRGETATTVNTMTGSADNRFAYKIQYFVETGIRDHIEMIIALDAQYLTKRRAVRILGKSGEEWKEISAEDISMNYDYIPEIGIYQMEGTAERQQWMELLNSLVGLMPLGLQLNAMEVAKESFSRFDVPDPERFVMPQGQMPAAMPPEVAGGGSPKKPQGVASQPGVAVSPVSR